MSTQIRLYLEIAAGIVLLSAFGLYTWHERSVGQEKIEASDAKALSAAKAQADAETALNLERASKADAGAVSAQKAVDDYLAAHPEQPIRLCIASNSKPSLPSGSPHTGSPSNPAPGSATLSEVPGRDIRPDLDAIVRAAERLDILYADRQQR